MLPMTTKKRLASFACLCSSLLWLSGCYQRVVAVKGGTYKGSIYEANVATEDSRPAGSSSQSK